jgi:hypothetical protein
VNPIKLIQNYIIDGWVFDGDHSCISDGDEIQPITGRPMEEDIGYDILNITLTFKRKKEPTE